jgi:hypothetical protein
MDDNEYILIDGVEYIEMLGSEAEEKLGVSRTTFYKDQKKGSWRSRPGFAGTTIYSVPRSYVEQRQEEKTKREQKHTTTASSIDVNVNDHLPQIDEAIHSPADSTWQQLVNEKDKRIQQLEDMLIRERELTAQALEAKDQTIAAKESEVNTMRGMLLLSSGKADANINKVTEQVEYAPVKTDGAPSLWQRLITWGK